MSGCLKCITTEELFLPPSAACESLHCTSSNQTRFGVPFALSQHRGNSNDAQRSAGSLALYFPRKKDRVAPHHRLRFLALTWSNSDSQHFMSSVRSAMGKVFTLLIASRHVRVDCTGVSPLQAIQRIFHAAAQRLHRA